MNYNLGTLQVLKVIIHDIPFHRAGDEKTKPQLSEIESDLSQDLKNYFKERINGSAASSSSFDVVFDSVSPSGVPNIVFEYLKRTQQNFVEMSQKIAIQLFGIQTGANSSGLLAVVDCILDGKPALSILKLEREEGVRVLTSKKDGKATFSLDLIKELMLTGKTKLFKIGLFVQTGKTVSSIDGIVCDYQRGYATTSEIADFFLSKFLGCLLKMEPDVATKKFFSTSEQFFNEQIPDTIVRGKYLTHLFSELTNEKASINPTEFASANLKATDRQKYVNYMEEHGAPCSVFSKDIKLIDNKISRMHIQFQSGISIIAPNDIFEKKVELSQLDTGETKAEITDIVQHMGSKQS